MDREKFADGMIGRLSEASTYRGIIVIGVVLAVVIDQALFNDKEQLKGLIELAGVLYGFLLLGPDRSVGNE